MTNIYYIRHAQPNYDNKNDRLRELTEKGLNDRAAVTQYLQNKDISRVISSPYKRAVDTIAPFAKSNNLEIEIIEDLRERKVDSVWIDDFDSFCKMQWADFNYKLSDGETLGEVQERNIAVIKDILQRDTDESIVIGGHGTALGTIINYYDTGFGLKEFERIRYVMPLAVHFTFNGQRFEKYEIVDLMEMYC